MEPTVKDPKTDIASGKIDLADYMGKCEWCYGPRGNYTGGFTIQGRCFNTCESCSSMLREKIKNKDRMDQAQDDMLEALWNVGHPGEDVPSGLLSRRRSPEKKKGIMDKLFDIVFPE